MKKNFKFIYIFIFVLILCVPVSTAVFGESSSIGNESETQMPSIIEDGTLNEDFDDEFEDWFFKSIPLRTLLIEGENNIKINLLKSSSNGVIAGKDNYLFSEEELDDYLGVTLSNRSIYRIEKTLSIVQNYVNSNGGKFAFTVVPNKSTLYPELMPERYIKGESSNLSKLSEVLSNSDVNYVDLYSLFNSIDENLYLRDDTHWNNLGALYGFNAMMSALGKEHKEYDGVAYTVKKDYVGDLTKMAFPLETRKCEQYYFEYNLSDFVFKKPSHISDNSSTLETLMGDEEKIDGLIQTVNENASSSLYILRDSFGRALLPYLIDNYNSTYITRYQPLNLLDGNFDNVIWEVVERNLADTLSTAPLVWASQIDSISPTQEISGDNSCFITKSDSVINIYGLLDEKYFDDDSSIYVVLQSDDNEYTYEAFPITEKEKLSLANDSDFGFSVYIDETTLEKSNYNVIMLISNKDEIVSTGVVGTLEEE